MPLRIVKPPEKSFLPLKMFAASDDTAVLQMNIGLLRPKHEITKNDYTQGTEAFGICFRLDDAEDAVSTGPKYLKFTDLENIAPEPLDEAMLVVYFGLKGNEVVHGLRFVTVHDYAINPELVDTAAGTNPSHWVVQDGTGGHKIEPVPSQWPQYSSAYTTRIRVKRTLGAFGKAPVAEHDTHAIGFPWDSEIAFMYGTNAAYANPSFEVRLVLSDYASFLDDLSPPRGHDGPNGYRHGASFHTAYRADATSSWTPMLTNGKRVLPYHYRGTNLGHLCPPKCRRTDAVGTE